MDPLGELCLAAAEDAEQENRKFNDNQNVLKKHVSTGPIQELEEVHRKTNTDLLVDLYKDQCNNEGVHPLDDHIVILSEIPKQLLVHTRECQVLNRVAGGAVLQVSGGCPLQLSALLTTLAPPRDSTILALLDTLDLSNTEVTDDCLQKMLENALVWGPWWRLRCLVLKNCGLGLSHLRALASADAVPCLWNLEYLDISYNPDIGLNSDGLIRGPEEFAEPDIAFLIHFWKHTKLQWLNMEHSRLGPRALRCILMILQKYEIPSNTLECGFAIHSGTRPVLQSLILGNAVDGVSLEDLAEMETLMVDELISLVKELPKISFLGVEGISDSQLSKIASSWESIHNGQKKVSADEHSKLQLAPCGAPQLSLPMDHIVPEYNFDLQLEDLEERSSPQLPRQILDDLGLNKAIQKPAAANDTEPLTLVATNKLDKYSLNIVSPEKVSRRQHRGKGGSIVRKSANKGQGQRGANQTHLYRGGDRNDVLPLGEIVLQSDSEGNSPREKSQGETMDSETSQSHDSGGGNTVDQGPGTLGLLTTSREKFRLRDGMLDEDSRLGRVYRSDARRNIMKIPNSDHQKAAKRAFKLWDQCTENSWDRRRWDNPSKTQNDEPHILGQLNLLFDLLDKYKLGIGFPFPLWRKGEGEHAFEAKVFTSGEIESDRANDSPRHRRLRTSVHVSPNSSPQKESSSQNDPCLMNGDRPMKSRAFVLSSDEEEEEENVAQEEPSKEMQHSQPGNERGKELKELKRLSAWAWDARVGDHPPNEEVYGPTRGKRQRKQLHGDVASFFESHIDETEIPVGEKQSDSIGWSSDDDLPLFSRVPPAGVDTKTAKTMVIPDSQDSDE